MLPTAAAHYHADFQYVEIELPFWAELGLCVLPFAIAAAVVWWTVIRRRGKGKGPPPLPPAV